MQEVQTAYREYLGRRGKSPRTIETYTNVVAEFVEFLAVDSVGAWLSVEAADKGIVERFLSSQSRADGTVSPDAWNQRMYSLRSLYDFLFKEQIVNSNPAKRIDRMTVKRPERIPLSFDEMVRMVETVERESPRGLRARNVAIVQVFIHVGLRVSEVASLNIDQVDFDREFLLDVRTKGQNWLSSRLNDTAMAALQDWLAVRATLGLPESEKALFVSTRLKRLSVRSIDELVPLYAELAGIPGRVTPHVLRHSSATEIVETCKLPLRNAQKFLNHQSVKTTELYVHDSGQVRRETAAAFDEEWKKRVAERQALRPTGT
jgi:site-specific recombinase XerD